MSTIYSCLTYFYDSVRDINDLCQFLISSISLDANSLPRLPLKKNINVSPSFHVNKSSVKTNMLVIVPYKL